MSGTSAPSRDDRSLAELTKELLRDVSALVRSEIQLAKAEVAEKGGRLAGGVGLAAAGAVVLLAMLGALVATAILALATTLPAWLAALIVAIVIGIIGGLLVLLGVRALRRATPPVPEHAVDSVKEDIAWVKTRAKSANR
ncbi:MAG TPA: phage holin family protein [Gaiellales bacterium]|nr:phage holin family protein [Gaiellales bacterium]